jgi:hypothetical protein
MVHPVMGSVPEEPSKKGKEGKGGRGRAVKM